MPANQHHAKIFNPNALNLIQVATYDRLILAPLVRVWENVLDWEHLPYLHETSFNYVELDTGGQWGWRTWSNADHTDHVELTLASADSYVARSYQAGHQVSEIWTTLTDVNDSTQVQVRFFMPDIEENKIEKLGQAMTRLYTQLWDEDEAMMQQRHKRLHEHRDDRSERLLGEEASIRSKLAGGDAVTFQLKRREYQITEVDGRLVAISTICPHLMGPLLAVDTRGGIIRCPWHGYQFDINSGKCVFPEHADCTLPAAPELVFSNGNIIARSGSGQSIGVSMPMNDISMRVSDIDWDTWQPEEVATLMFIIRGDSVLLIRKKRGLGAGKINGPGGRLENGETPEACAIRETNEELVVNPLNVRAAGELFFHAEDMPRIHGYVFIATDYEGTPTETDEAIPLWFKLDELPFDEMWDDDRLWLPQILSGQRVRGHFTFVEETMLDHKVEFTAG